MCGNVKTPGTTGTRGSMTWNWSSQVLLLVEKIALLKARRPQEKNHQKCATYCIPPEDISILNFTLNVKKKRKSHLFRFQLTLVFLNTSQLY